MGSNPTGSLHGSITFCVTGKSGLGHLRRTANIAAAIRRLRGEVALRIVANAPVDCLAPEERALFAQTCVVERGDMARCLAELPEGPVVADTAVIADLEVLPRRLILVLRETIVSRLAAFRMPGGRSWDATLVAAPASDWSVAPEAVGSRSVENVGWIFRRASIAGSRVLPPRDRTERLVLVATGGGGTPATAAAFNRELDAVLARARRLVRQPLRVLQVLGPRAPGEARLASADAIVDVGSRLDEAFAEADLVVSTAGYNSVLELATTDTPSLLCPISRTYDDQAARAAVWAGRLGLDHRPFETERSALWIAETLSSGRRRHATPLGTCGSERAAERILAHLGQPLAAEAAFTKPERHDAAHARCSIPQRTRRLFIRSVPTPPGAACPGSGSVTFARLEGPTAYQEWASMASGEKRTEVERRLASQILVPLLALHRSDRDGFDLPWLDPWRRVEPRLARTSEAAIALGAERMAEIDRICARLAAIELAPRRSYGLVHGDFHLGQLVRPLGRPDFIVVDLDDLALGPPEADIANCAAHIATSVRLYAGPVMEGVRENLALLGDAYEIASGATLEQSRLRWHAALALLRRAMKLAERSGCPAGADEIVSAAARLVPDAHRLADEGRKGGRDAIPTPVPERMGARS